MKKILSPTDILKLGLAGALDIFEEISDPFGIMAHGYMELYGWVPSRYKRRNFSRVLLKSLKTGDINKVVKKGQVYLRLTSKGREKVKRDFPLLTFQKKRWDEKWRVVFYDISEVNKRVRNMLRRKLKELGFGMVQRSTWITPHDFAKDMREFIEVNKLGEEVFILEAPHLLAGDPRILANKVWGLRELNKAYIRLFQKIMGARQMYVALNDRRKQRTVRSEVVLQARLKKTMREIRSRYLQILITDPFLPKKLLPDGWMGEKVRREIKSFGMEVS